MHFYSTRRVLWLLGSWALLLLLGISFVGDAWADTGTANPATGSIQADALLRQMQEIACLQLITPLHFTQKQLKQIEAILEDSIQNYDKQMKAVANKYFAALVPRIESARRDALQGKALPDALQKDFEDALNALLKERDHINKENIASVSAKVQPLLTDEQFKTAIQLAHHIPGFNTQSGTNAQWFHLWVASALLDYDKIVPLLKELEHASMAKSTNVPSSSGKEKINP